MKIALLGDIGANLPALEAVLNHAKTHGVSQFLNVGNSLGFGIYPDETIQRLQMENVVSILGRFDARVLKSPKNLEQLKKTKAPDELIFLNRIYQSLSANSLNYLSALKRSAIVNIHGKTILLTNQPPRASKYPSPVTGEETIQLQLPNEADIIAFSRQQFPYLKRINNIRFLNTGAVGYAYDIDIWACYTVLQFSLGFMKVHQYHIKYDISGQHTKTRISEIPKTISQTTYPEIIAETIKQSYFVTKSAVVPSVPLSKKTAGQFKLGEIESVQQLLASCIDWKYANHHAQQVNRLALELFDQLQTLHHLTDEERNLLQYGSILHDVGWMNGRKGHHKVAFNIIVNTTALPFPKRERFIIALLALYHRKSAPTVNDLPYATLEPNDRQIVSYLTAILRIADALDNSHQNLIENLHCNIDDNNVSVIYSAKHPAEREFSAVSKKGRFFEEVFERKLVCQWKAI
ncbi:MAG TPA: hypothetical protein DDW50_16425 [Firmicutes bacterium]|jgi:hypothetical protein|nr:hypothetical protein [Bacillota bacterium]